MKSNIRKILLSAFLVSSTLISFNSYSAQERIEYEATNLLNQSMHGCEYAEKINKAGKTFSEKSVEKDDTDFICDQDLHENFSNQYAVTSNSIIDSIIPIIFIAFAIGFSLKILRGAEGHGNGWARFIILLAITGIFTYPVFERTSQIGVTSKYSAAEYIVDIVFKVFGDEANEKLNEANEIRQYYFADVYVPEYEKLTSTFEEAIEFFNSVNGIAEGQQVVFNVVEFEGNLKAEANIGKYQAEIIIPLDGNCIKVAEQYGLFDCRQKQIEWQKTYLTAALQLASSSSQNFMNSFNDAGGSKIFDLSMSCENIDKLNLKSYSQNDLQILYLKKAAACASRVYTEGLHKLGSFTTDDYLKNQNYLKSRRISICTQDESSTFKYTGYSKKEAKEKVNACVENACGGEGSPYMCSAAVAIYQSLQDDAKYNWLTIPAFILGDIGENITANAEVFGSKFNFTYKEFDNEYSVNNNATPIFTMVFSTAAEKKTVEYSYFEMIKNWAAEQWQYITGMDIEFSVEQVNNLGSLSNDGFWGTERLSTCLANPRQHINGWNCGGSLLEFLRNGVRNIKSGVNGLVASHASLSKLQGTKRSSKAEVGQTSWSIKYMVPAKDAAILGYFINQSMQTNIYEESDGDISSAVTNAGIAMASALGGETIRGIIQKSQYAQIAYGIILAFILPAFLIYGFVKSLTQFITNSIIHKLLIPFNFAQAAVTNGSMNNRYAREDVDIPDWIINCVLIVIYPASMVIGALYLVVILDVVFAVMPSYFLEIVNKIMLTDASQITESSVLVNSIVTRLAFALLSFLILKMLIFIGYQVGTKISWLWFGNGELDTADENEEKHNEVFSRLK